MKEIILCKLGEIVLKGLNRKSFEQKLLSNLRHSLYSLGNYRVWCSQSTVYIEPGDDEADMDAAFEAAKKVFGVIKLSRAAACEKDKDAITELAKSYLRDELMRVKTFKVETKRSDKRFPLTSIELSQYVGGELAEAFPHLRAEMHEPELVIHLEVRDVAAYVHASPESGAGGMPVGSNGLVCLPYFAGERTPIDDPNARGAFLGLTINHTREDMLRAGLEGVAYSINQHFKIFEEDGIPIGRVLVAGGGTKNDAWMQIVADVTGKTLFVPEITIGASYGDAMMAAIAAGYWADFDELASKVKIAKTFEPCAENHEAYKKFQAIFDELYPATKELAHQL